jgi:hypothetical protein
MQDADNLYTPWRLPIKDQVSSHMIFVICQKGLPLCHERFAVEPAGDYTRLLEALRMAQ